MRITGLIEYAVILAGLIGVVAGSYFGQPKGFQLGLCVMGIGITIAAFEGTLLRQMPLRFSDYGWDNWSGFPSMLIGLVLLIIGLGLIGSAYLIYNGQWSQAIDFIAENPGPALSVIGLIMLCVGMLVVFITDRYGSMAWFIFVVAPKLMFGSVLLLVGLAVLGGGIWATVAQDKFTRFINDTATSISLPQPMPLLRQALVKLR